MVAIDEKPSGPLSGGSHLVPDSLAAWPKEKSALSRIPPLESGNRSRFDFGVESYRHATDPILGWRRSR